MKKLLIVYIPLLLMFSGCANLFPSFGGAKIDWVDFINLNDINYVSEREQREVSLNRNDIDKEIAKVKFMVADNVKNPNYKTKNGDAAFWEKGTPIYSLKGYSPDFRIAVEENGSWRMYEVETNRRAKTGREMLDIENRVVQISISDTQNRAILAEIKDEGKVKKLVDMVMNAKVDVKIYSSGESSGDVVWITFHLKDGTKVSRIYRMEPGEIFRGIYLPKEFEEEIRDAIHNKLVG